MMGCCRIYFDFEKILMRVPGCANLASVGEMLRMLGGGGCVSRTHKGNLSSFKWTHMCLGMICN